MSDYLTTAAQAAQRWCPWARTSDGVSTVPPIGVNRGQPSVMSACRCLADRCQVWRWAEPVYEEQFSADGPPEGEGWERAVEENQGWTYRRPREPESRRGYCGLVPAQVTP